eukprot:Em0022g347a
MLPSTYHLKLPAMAEDIPTSFYQPSNLFLKADAKVFMEVKLPEIKVAGVTVSNWEVMEKIKNLANPEVFQTLRVANYTREVIQFEGEFESLRSTRKVVLMLNGKSIKLSGFSETLKLRARQAEMPFPAKEEWEEYFAQRGLSSFDEGKPGERPDTIRIRGMPVKWFTSPESEGKPCPHVLTKAFQKFGKAYVQFEKYEGFCSAMHDLKGMKLMHVDEAGKESVARVTVDFDKAGFLSERNIRKRKQVEEDMKREALEKQRKLEEEKLAEEKRKEEQLKAEEELKAQRRLQKIEEKRLKKEQQATLAATLKAIAYQRKVEAQRLFKVLLAGAAEARLQEEQASLERQREEEKQRKHREEEKRERERKERERTDEDGNREERKRHHRDRERPEGRHHKDRTEGRHHRRDKHRHRGELEDQKG